MSSQHNKSDLHLDWCSHEAAKYAVEHWHYSRSMPVGKTVRVGVWESGAFIGCVLFAYGANNNLLKPYGLTQTEGCELVRVALTSHVTPVSRIVAIALRMLHGLCPGLRLVVSFADLRQGHIGSIYQAGGWVYVGSCNPPTEYKWNGRWVHSMQITTMMRAGKCKTRTGLEKRKGSMKHRYAMPLDADMRKRIMPLSKPYPKCAGSVRGDTLADQAGEGGSSPTPALHSKGAA